MKKLLFAIVSFVLLLSCSSEGTHYKNPYLPNYSFSFPMNLDLPLYSALRSPINPKIFTDPGSGLTMIVMKISDTDYRAWDVNCPNHAITSCSRMTLVNGNAKCSCDDIEYSLFTGIGAAQYPMKPYRVEVSSPTSIRIYN